MRPQSVLVAAACTLGLLAGLPDAPSPPVDARERVPLRVILTNASDVPAPLEGAADGLRWQHAELVSFLEADHRHKHRPRPTRQVEYRAASSGSINGYPCGGDLPPCWVLARESGGNPRAVNPTGCGGYTCGGLWQFDPRTWASFGGYLYAQDAPVDVQNEKARLTWAGGRGCSHWSAC